MAPRSKAAVTVLYGRPVYYDEYNEDFTWADGTPLDADELVLIMPSLQAAVIIEESTALAML